MVYFIVDCIPAFHETFLVEQGRALKDVRSNWWSKKSGSVGRSFICLSLPMHELRFLQKGKTFPHMSEAREDINPSGPLALQSKSLESFFEDKGEAILGWLSDMWDETFVLIPQVCPTICYPIGYSLPVSSFHGIFQARILEWVAILFSRDLPDPGIKPRSPELQEDSLLSKPAGKPNVEHIWAKRWLFHHRGGGGNMNG